MEDEDVLAKMNEFCSLMADCIPPIIARTLVEIEPQQRVDLLARWFATLKENEFIEIIDTVTGQHVFDWQLLHPQCALFVARTICRHIAASYRYWAVRIDPDASKN